MEQLLAILTECCPDIDFEHETALVDDELLASLDIVMLVGELNEAYGISITVDDLVPENFNSAQGIYALVQRLQGE